MEATAFFAVAAFRALSFGQLLYAGDDQSEDAWDERGWDDHARRVASCCSDWQLRSVPALSLPDRLGTNRFGILRP